MGNVLTRDELIKICKSIVLVAIPMTVLIALQFYSPQSAWVNKSVAGDTGAGFTGALGFFRPPGTFSFTNGNSLFYSFASCMIFYFWLNPKLINRVILIAATVALVAAIPLSISRSLIFQIALVTIFVMIAISRQPKFLGRILLALFGGLIFVVVLSQTAFFQKSSEALAARFESASNSEGGLKGTIVDRYLGGLLTAFTSSTDQPFFGYGIGMGTNVGNKLLASSHIYLIAEDEWGREVGEMGPLLGLLMIFIRIGLTFKLAVASYRRIVVNDLLPWLLASFGLLMLSQGGWAQPTSLGFSVVISGMLMASVRNKKVMKRLSFQINDQAISPLGLVG